jgi:hypothetical protein
LTDAAVTDPADPMRKASAVYVEFVDWIHIFEPLIGISDRTNETRLQPLGGFFPDFGLAIDRAQGRYRDALLAAMNAVNVRCLADKATVNRRVSEVLFLRYFWGEQFPTPRPEIFLPFDEVFCVDIRIDAAPPPVLTPGIAALMPIDLRIRFIDGVELPGPPLVVTITSTNGTVSPAGGTLPTPITTPPVSPMLTPTATSA